MAVAGLRGTGDWGPDERPTNFRESILFMEPNGDTPLLGLTSKVKGKSRVTNDPQFSWWSEPMDIIRLQVNGALGASDTLVVVDSGDPDAVNFKQNFGKATHLVPGDILMVEPAVDTVADVAERVLVTQVNSETSFTIKRGVQGTTAGVIADDGFLLKVGTIFAEGTSEPQAASRNPIKFSNFTQIFKTTYELTGTAAETFARTGDTIQNDKKRRAFDHAKDMEMAFFWGKRGESIGTNGKPERSMAGLREFIPPANTTILADDWGVASSVAAGNNLLDAVSPVFDYSTPGGDTRIAFIGNGALNAINKALLLQAKNGLEINFGSKDKFWGVNFRELIFPQGRLMLKTHPLLSRHPIYTYSMWIIDFSAIQYVPMKGRDTKALDDIQNKGEDVRRGLWQTEASIMVDYAGQSLGYVGGFNKAIAA